MRPIWIIGSNIDSSSPLLTPAEKLEKESEERKKRNEDRELNKKNSEIFEKISFNIRGLVRGFTSLFKGGISLGGTTTSDGISLGNLDNDALMRVFNDTWQYEMGGKGPGTVEPPLNDGAGKNYGVASFTQKWNMQPFRTWLKEHYPKLEAKLVGETCSLAFDASWKKLGETDEKEFFKAQVEYTLESKLIPWIKKIKSSTGIDLNSGKYSEGVFSILLSMSNQRPAWIDELVIPFFKNHPNANSTDIINGLGGHLANNYNGNYRDAIRNRYKKQVANSLTMTTPFSLNGISVSSSSTSNNSTKSTSGSSVVYSQNSPSNSTAVANTQKYINPLPGYTITSSFGPRKAPTAGASSNHKGTDIGAPEGTPVKAMADGIVIETKTGYNGGRGYYVLLKHPNGDTTRYQHLSAIDVKQGQTVKQGQSVGKVGNTGVGTGPHLHVEMTKDDQLVDAMKYIGKDVGGTLSDTSSTVTNTSASSTLTGIGVFNSEYAITDDEKAQEEAKKHWKELRESGGHAYNSIHNDTEKGENKAEVVKENTSGWKPSYRNDTSSLANYNKPTFNPSKSNNGNSPYEKINNSNSTPNYSSPSNDTTIGNGSIIIIPPKQDDSKPQYTPPSIIEIDKPVKPNTPSDNTGNNDSTIIKPDNPTYFFDKEKFEEILNKLIIINDYTGEIKTTNELLTKMKKIISDNKEKCKKNNSENSLNKTNRVINNSNGRNNLYDSIFKGNSYIEDQFFFGF